MDNFFEFQSQMLKDCAEMPVTPFVSNSGNWEKKSKAVEAVSDFLLLWTAGICGYFQADHGNNWTVWLSQYEVEVFCHKFQIEQEKSK